MARVRIVMAGMPQAVLPGIVRKVAGRRPDMRVVGHFEDRSELTDRVRASGADVVILELFEHEIPRICGELTAAIPGLVVVGMAGDGRQVLVQADGVGANDLMNTIRTVCGVDM